MSGYRYYGAFAPGLEECIAEVLGERAADLAIPLLLSGAVVFETALPYDRLNFFCFNNVFRLIAAEFPGDGTRPGRGPRPSGEAGPDRVPLESLPGKTRPALEDLENFVRRTIRTVCRKAGSESLGGGASGPEAGFRVIFSLENSPVALNDRLRREAEAYISSLSGLRVNRSRPGVEFWFLLRREGAFFLRRLSRHRPWDRLLHPGELPPPLAWMLCRLSDPRPGEKTADPFCGYGSIPAARLRHFPPAEFFASDIDRGALKIAQNKFRGKRHCCHFNCIDAEELTRIIPPGTLDSVITDPPWGLYQKSGAAGQAGQGSPAAERYARSLALFSGLLKPGGRVVMLCGREAGLRTMAEQEGFTLIRDIPILLSGRKAEILALRRA